MGKPELSAKGKSLIELYSTMANEGYDRTDLQRVDVAFSDFELRAYKVEIQTLLNEHSISTVLDYGCGGSDWRTTGFDEESGQSAIDYFKLREAHRYEPARDIDERQNVDCVISFDVLEHIFIADVPSILRDIFCHATKLVVLNVACYPAAAKLPNGENAHITVRNEAWWKGMLDSISAEYPTILVYLMCSAGWRNSVHFPIWSANMWQESSTFVVEN